MMDLFDLSSRLFGSTRAEVNGTISNAVDVVSATGAADSSDGETSVYLDADVTPADDSTGDDAAIGVPTSPAVSAGDEVLIGLTGSGPLKVPVVLSNPGSGDRQQTQISTASTLATHAAAVANATGQHFWEDADGAHVTEVTRDEWEDSNDANYHSGPNSLWNSLGMLFRDGLTNLLAVLTSGIAIYDGNGNDESNILAKFYKYTTSGRTAARVDFFNGDGFVDYNGKTLNAFTVSARDDSSGGTLYNTARMNLFQSANNKISNVEVLAGANGTGARPASIQLDSRTEGTTESSIYSYADYLLLNYYGSSGSEQVSMPQAIVALTQPCETCTGSNSTTTESSYGWHKSAMDSVQGSSGTPTNYYAFSNGVITALRDVLLEISGVAYWQSGGTGAYGFGLFIGSTTVGSGNEKSVFSYKASSSGQFYVSMPPRLIPLSSGDSIAVGRYSQSGAVYRNGVNFSFITIKVIEDRS